MRSSSLAWICGGAAIAGVGLSAGALWLFSELDQATMIREGAALESHMLSSQRDEIKQLQASPNKNTTIDGIQRREKSQARPVPR